MLMLLAKLKHTKLGKQNLWKNRAKNFCIFPREKFRGSEHFFWDYILNTRKANALRVDHKKSPKNPFFSFY